MGVDQQRLLKSSKVHRCKSEINNKVVWSYADKAENYMAPESGRNSPDLAYLYANEALLLCDGPGNPTDVWEEMEALRQRALYTLMPAKKPVDKAAELYGEAKLFLRRLPNYPKEILELLLQAHKFHSTPSCLSAIAGCYAKLGCYELAYVHASEALERIVNDSDNDSDSDKSFGGSDRSEVLEEDEMKNKQLRYRTLLWSPSTLNEKSRRRKMALNQSGGGMNPKWPKGLQIRSLCIDSGSQPRILRRCGTEVKPEVSYAHLPSFLAHHVAHVEELTFHTAATSPSAGIESCGPQREYLLQLLGSTGSGAKCLTRCKQITFHSLFHYLSPADVQRLFNGGGLAAGKISFVDMHWNSESTGSNSDSFALRGDLLLGLRMLRECTHLSFTTSNAADEKEGTGKKGVRHGQRTTKPSLPLTPPRAEFSSDALLAWLKADSSRCGNTRRSLHLTDAYLAIGVGSFMQLLLDDFDYPAAVDTTSTRAIPLDIRRPQYYVRLECYGRAAKTVLELCLGEAEILERLECQQQWSDFPRAEMRNRRGEVMFVYFDRNLKNLATGLDYDSVLLARNPPKPERRGRGRWRAYA